MYYCLCCERCGASYYYDYLAKISTIAITATFIMILNIKKDVLSCS